MDICRAAAQPFGLGQLAGRCDDQGKLSAGIRLLPPARQRRATRRSDDARDAAQQRAVL
jgi:hypothetical protein